MRTTPFSVLLSEMGDAYARLDVVLRPSTRRGAQVRVFPRVRATDSSRGPKCVMGARIHVR